MKKKVIVIVGPTAVGKTALSIELAKKFKGEIISGDSMQVYTGMDIGTAKISSDEMDAIPHHLIDMIEPNNPYTVADFQTDVRTLIHDIHTRGNIPIIVGGSGLYIESALYNFTFSDQKRNFGYTEKLEKIIAEKGIGPLYEQLKEVDPEQARKIHPNNHRKVIRALEIFETTGKTMSERQKDEQKELLFDVLFLGLEMERKMLYDRINERVNVMIEKGLIDEVRLLITQGFAQEQSMKAIGYKEIISYIDGNVSKEDAIELLKRNSRRFAKRQFTWFKNRLSVNWYDLSNGMDPQTFNNILDYTAGFLEDK